MKAHLKAIDFFLHPVPLFAVALMAINDHYLKYLWPGVITGKLSDFAGVFYFPIFFSAVIVLLIRLLAKRNFQLNLWIIWTSILLTDLIMILLKLNPTVSQFLEAQFAQHLFHIQIVNDPWDLISLSMNAPTLLFLKVRRYFLRPTAFKITHRNPN